ncbi:hypothetical protein CDAR_587711 [Caerostris darwini]|uniref:Uncharacterized protein n=1 Tax=Caerostris darwini TaxID=1538125 RepID=A0AAV4SJZ8_9ARAC|nr:hypothetical protein CDAR_587711 [Caerostris darwini]
MDGSSNCVPRKIYLKSRKRHMFKECSTVAFNDNPICINCGQKGHIASWKGSGNIPLCPPKKDLYRENKSLKRVLTSQEVDLQIPFAAILISSPATACHRNCWYAKQDVRIEGICQHFYLP